MSTTVSMTDTERQAQNASERVLIVEDDNAARSGLTELVRTWGFLTDSAADGEEGLQKVSQFRPSIILTDLVMPRRTGLELLEAVREVDPGIAVILLTAQGTVETAVEAIRSGCAFCWTRRPSGSTPCAKCRCCAATCATRAPSAR